MSERARRKEAEAARRRIANYNDVHLSGGTPDLDDVRALADGDDPDIATRAAFLLLLCVAGRGYEAFEAETPQLIRIGRSEILSPLISAILLSTLAWTRCLRMLEDYSRTQRQPDPGLLSETAELAELGYARAPNSYYVRKALAMVRCAQARDREARDLLVAIPLERLKPDFRADILAIRALAELQMHDFAQARRVLNLARQFGHSNGLLTGLEKAVTAAERHSAAGAPGQEP